MLLTRVCSPKCVFFVCHVPFIPRTGIKSEPWQVIVDSLMPAAMVYNYTWQEVRIPNGAINIFLGSRKTKGVDSGETTSKTMLSRNRKAWLKWIVVKRNSWKQCLLTLVPVMVESCTLRACRRLSSRISVNGCRRGNLDADVHVAGRFVSRLF